jgi:hypothetical protein
MRFAFFGLTTTIALPVGLDVLKILGEDFGGDALHLEVVNHDQAFDGFLLRDGL